MALSVWFQDDIRQAITGLLTATIETAIRNGAGNVEHTAGLLTMSKGMALSFGLSWPSIVAEVRAAMDVQGIDLLESAAHRMIQRGSR